MEYELGTIKVEAEIHEENRETIESLSDVTARYSELGQKQKEHVYAVFLTNANEEIGDELITLGTSNTASFDPKKLARTAALVNAGAIILVHNHPSGKAEPTDKDIQATKDVKNGLDTLGIDLLDHVIITHRDNYSMRRSRDGPFAHDTGGETP